MSEIDWNLVETELKAPSAPRPKNDRDVSEQSEIDVLKHIEDALRMDIVPSDRAGTRRG